MTGPVHTDQNLANKASTQRRDGTGVTDVIISREKGKNKEQGKTCDIFVERTTRVKIRQRNRMMVLQCLNYITLLVIP